MFSLQPCRSRLPHPHVYRSRDECTRHTSRLFISSSPRSDARRETAYRIVLSSCRSLEFTDLSISSFSCCNLVNVD